MNPTRDMSSPWLAGVCAWLAWRMDWSVFGVRAVTVIAGWIAPVTTVAAYLLAALCLGLLSTDGPEPAAGRDSPPEPPPRQDPLARRIAEMERRLAEFDAELDRRGPV